jgi:hypothetical protein
MNLTPDDSMPDPQDPSGGSGFTDAVDEVRIDLLEITG